jgi:hypothetical protein
VSGDEHREMIRDAQRRLGELFDQIDAQTRRPGEPSLRAAVSEHAREQLAAMKAREHELRYRAGSGGLTHIGIADNPAPHWYCTCGGWRVNRDGQGRPFRETAEKRHRKHVREVSDV